ncbi:hypothetical protein DL546_000807 [Coniochaeta pulveracea]|uniref:Uncharacterized protein n=1 Tax=Coniochaeta pulveracea TaxID=177199 RepID=A0A420XW97_9PEZI|nr:hypothetical protein DL546_000807 [Coniochaeta pulveracea]
MAVCDIAEEVLKTKHPMATITCQRNLPYKPGTRHKQANEASLMAEKGKTRVVNHRNVELAVTRHGLRSVHIA